MKRGLKATLCFVVTVISLIAVILLVTRLVRVVIEENQSLVVFQGPGTATFTVEEAGTVKLWHDYQTFFNDETVSHEEELPTGYRFSSSPVGSSAGSSAAVPLVVTGTNERMTIMNTERVAVGSFALPSAGEYEVTVTAPPGESRIFSVSKGGAFQILRQFMMVFIFSFLLALIGISTLVIGIYLLASEPKKAAPLTHAP